MLTSRCSFVALVSTITLLCACSGDSFEGVPTAQAGSSGQPSQTTGGQAGSGGSAGQASPGGAVGGSGGMAMAGIGGASGAAGKAGGSSEICTNDGEFFCENDVIFVCSKGKKDALQVCETGLCDAKKGNCLDCAPGKPTGCFNSSTQEVCNEDGVGSLPQKCPEGKPLCTAKGSCVECIVDGDCSPSTKECQSVSCVKGACVEEPLAKGIESTKQTPKDCKKRVCDGSGKAVSEPDDTDKPDADSTCSVGSCLPAGEPSQTHLKAGEPCDNGGFCNGIGSCGVCVPDATGCDAGTTLKTCDKQGNWSVGTACDKDTPACFDGACSKVVSLSAGAKHTCALFDNGSVRCWGEAKYGTLGSSQGAGLFSSKPLDVESENKFVQISSGELFTCGLTDGDIWCWGANLYGEIASGEVKLKDITSKPLKVNSDKKFVEVSAGNSHVCAVTDDQDVLCWGSNSYGESAQKDVDSNVLSPQLVAGIGKTKHVALGAGYSCSLSLDGHVFCWGNDSDGVLGIGEGDQTGFQPKQVALLTGLTHLSAGSHHFAAYRSPSIEPDKKIDIWMWGDGTYGQNLASPKSDYQSPAQMHFSDGADSFIDRVFLGRDVSLFSSDLFSLMAGYNADGRLGDGKKYDSGISFENVPIDIVSMASADGHTCALQSTGRVWCWGQNDRGQLGTGDTEEHLIPMEVKW